MSRLSLCMIVRDEEYFLDDCLRAARPQVDEIVVVDTGSMDRSREIAAQYADVCADFEWIDDFSAARNHSLELASGDWILVLDADEQISPENFHDIRGAMAGDDYDGYLLEHRNYSNEKHIKRQSVPPGDPFARGYTWYSTTVILRMFRRDPTIRFCGSVHEDVAPTIRAGRVGELDVPIHHYLYASPNHPRRDRVLRYLEMMDRELAQRPNGRIYSIAGASALHEARDYDKAANYLLRAAEYGYERNRSLEGAAEASYAGGRHEQARRIYREAYRRGHRSPTMCLNMANLAARAGEELEAIELLEECLALGGVGEDKDSVVRGNIDALRGSLATRS